MLQQPLQCTKTNMHIYLQHGLRQDKWATHFQVTET